jgi:hypothetical protein
MLEIGLGCDMDYGPGKSLAMWKEFMPKVKIDVLEFNSDCAKKFINQANHVYIGDQGNLKLLNQIVTESRYDLIVDDGGHTRKQQINSLIGLWPSLNPNGIYVIEDIFTSVMDGSGYIDFSVSTIEVVNHLILLLNKQSSQFKMRDIDQELAKIGKELFSVSCYSEACVLVKKG